MEERWLEHAIKHGMLNDGVIAASEAQRQELWALRENPSEARRAKARSLRHDVSVPVSKVPTLIERGAARSSPASFPTSASCRSATWATATSTTIPPAASAGRPEFFARRDEMQRRVFEMVAALGGTISAEHGLGRLKRAEMASRKPEVELELMRSLKKTLDPKGILNPGAVL